MLDLLQMRTLRMWIAVISYVEELLSADGDFQMTDAPGAPPVDPTTVVREGAPSCFTHTLLKSSIPRANIYDALADGDCGYHCAAVAIQGGVKTGHHV